MMGKASRRRRDQTAPAGDPPASMTSVCTPTQQMQRVADFLRSHPGATAKEVAMAIDVAGIPWLISAMRSVGFGIRKGWRTVRCDDSNDRTRQVRTYHLWREPSTAQHPHA